MRQTFRALVVTTLVSCAAAAAQDPDLYDIPTIRTLKLTFHQTDWWTQLETNRLAKIYIKADLELDGRVLRDVGVRFRGNASFFALDPASRKKPFKIATDEFVPDQTILGYKTLNLNNNFLDATMVREVLSYEIFRRYMPAPKCNYIKLVVNNEDFGLYINAQQINKDLLQDYYPSKDGNRYRGERDNLNNQPQNSALTWLGPNRTSYEPFYELQNDEHGTAYQDIIRACNVLNNTPPAQLMQALPPVLDDDNALWMLACTNTLVWLDSYLGRLCHNFYLYSDDLHQQLSFIPWDVGNGLGVYNDGFTTTTIKTYSLYYQETNTSRPIANKMWAQPLWRARYQAHVRTLATTEFDPATVHPRITELLNLIQPHMLADPKRLYSMQLFTDNQTRDIVTTPGFRYTVVGLRPLIDGRRAYLLGHADIARPYPAMSDLGHAPQTPKSSEPVWVTVRASSPNQSAVTVSLFWRAIGAFVEAPMFDDGNHQDGAANDGVFGAMIPAQAGGARVQYYASARLDAQRGNAMAFLPPSASHLAAGYRVAWDTRSFPVAINELMAINQSTIQDERGQWEDWLELWNGGTQPVALDGMFLTDDTNRPTKWAIPANTTLQPGATLLVWCDEDLTQGPNHADFKLSGEGEEIALFDTDGRTLLNGVVFGPQVADVATGFLRNRGTPWVTLFTATPNASNELNPCGARRYSALDPTRHPVLMAVTGTPRIGGSIAFDLSRGPGSGAFIVLLAGNADRLDLANPAFSVLVSLPQLFMAVVVPASASGSASVPLSIPDDPALVGVRLYAQAIGSGAVLTAGNGVEVRFCPR